MGLDMYLRAQKYVSGYDHYKGQPEFEEYHRLVQAFGLGEFVDKDTPSATVSFTVGYWRKANAIHKWFVDNVQGGEDNCQEYYVSHEQLAELRSTCQEVMKSLKMKDGKVYAGRTMYPDGRVEDQYIDGKVATYTALAEELLPGADGFFFGSTDYDDWYVRCLEETVTIVDRVLKLEEGSFDIYYQSSW